MNRRESILAAVSLLAVQGCRPDGRSAPRTPQERYDREVGELKAATVPYKRWVALGGAAKAALALEKDAEAKGYAEELQRLAPSYKTDWNYGNAIQDLHIVLGVITLRAGDVAAAKQHLLDAGASPGSPQMDSFGPNMTLAKALIEAGQRDVVLEYFERCRKFWKMDRGRLNEWRDEVKAGRTPNFGANLVY